MYAIRSYYAMPTTIPVLSIVVDKQINRIPSAKVVIIDGNPAEQDFAINKTDYFIPGNEIEIKLGYDSNDETVFKGIIIKNSIKVSSFSATLNIECRDKTTKLTTSRKSKVFTDSTDSDAFYTILENHEIDRITSYNVCYTKLLRAFLKFFLLIPNSA